MDAGQPAECITDFVWSCALPPDSQGRLALLQGFLHLAGEITFMGTSFEQLGLALGRELVSIAERRRVLSCRLAVSASCCRLLGRQWRIAEHQHPILRPSRV